MNVTVNGEQHVLMGSKSLDAFIASLKLQSEQGVAVCINEEIINRSEWSTHVIHENDRIELIQATQGG